MNNNVLIEQEQIQTIAPQIMQSLKILSFSNDDLKDFLVQQAQENPLIDLEFKHNTASPLKPVDKYLKSTEYTKTRRDNTTQQQEIWGKFEIENNAEKHLSLYEHLLSELDFLTIPENDKRNVIRLIEYIEPNGYLLLDEDKAYKTLGININDYIKALKIIQNFDPPGIGALNLKECLILQLKRKGIFNDKLNNLIDNHLVNLANKRYNIISKQLGLSIKKVQEMHDLIKTLNPKPGAIFGYEKTHYVNPDVYVLSTDKGYVIRNNDRLAPQVCINKMYKDMLLNNNIDSKTREYIMVNLNRSIWLVNKINQRINTINRVAQVIVDLQKDFFDKGINFLRPLNLNTIAQTLQLHESTISRACAGKYMQTPCGILEFKFFFNNSINSVFGNISSNKVKIKIKEIIDSENTRKPLSDQRIAEILNEQGINIARRTISKYRECLNIPNTVQRRRF